MDFQIEQKCLQWGISMVGYLENQTTHLHSDKLIGMISHYNIFFRKLFNTYLIMKSSEPMAQTVGSQDSPVRDRIG